MKVLSENDHYFFHFREGMSLLAYSQTIEPKEKNTC